MDEVTKKYEKDPLLSSNLSSHDLLDREGYQERIAFNHDLQRPRRDLPWLVAHVAFLLVSLAGGLVAWAAMPRDARALASVAALQLAEEDSCPVGARGRRHLMAQDGGVPAINYVMLGIFLLCGSLGIGWAFVLAFKHKPVLMVKASLLLAVLTPAMGGITAMAQGSWLTCLVWLSTTAFLAWIFYTWRNQIELVGRLLGVAGHAFTDTPELIVLSVGLQILHWAAVYAPAASFLYAALLNGSVVANSARVPGRVASEPTLGIGGLCLDANDHPVACCIWQVDSWAQAYAGILIVTVLWSILLVGQIKLFTVGGAVAQWYFATSLMGAAPHTPVKLPVGRVQRSLRHALGPSLGSLCMGAAVLALVSTLRAVLNSIERHRYVACCLLPVAWVLRLLLGAVEFLTRFTTIRLSLTGESFMDGARSTAALLKRNALDTLGMWWLPSLILKGSAIVMSLLYGWFMYGLMSVIAGTPEEVLMLIISWAISWMVLHFFCDLLLNVVDTVFLCYAMDRDMSKITRQDVFDILKEVPGLAGPVVEQPDGGLAYGAPTSTNARTANNV